MSSPLRIKTRAVHGRRMTKAERRMVKRNRQTRFVQYITTNKMRKRLRGVHWRWTALGDWLLVHNKHPPNILNYLADYNWLGADFAIDPKSCG